MRPESGQSRSQLFATLGGRALRDEGPIGERDGHPGVLENESRFTPERADGVDAAGSPFAVEVDLAAVASPSEAGDSSVRAVVGEGSPTGGVGSHDGDLRQAVDDGAEGEQLAVW